MSSDSEQVDSELRQHFDRGDFDRTATLFLERYGQEILGFLTDRMHSGPKGADVFSQFAEDFWRGLPDFGWRSSLRAWAYALARNAAYRYRQSPGQRLKHQTFSDDSPFGMEVARLHSSTRLHQKTEVKSRMRQLRERLSEDDQTLLMLRVDRGLSWKELAVVLCKKEDLDPSELAREATNLRQRFQQVKARLRSLAVKEGLLGDDSSSG